MTISLKHSDSCFQKTDEFIISHLSKQFYSLFVSNEIGDMSTIANKRSTQLETSFIRYMQNAQELLCYLAPGSKGSNIFLHGDQYKDYSK